MPDSSLAAAGGVLPAGRGASRPADALDTQREVVAWWSSTVGRKWALMWTRYLLERIEALIDELTECHQAHLAAVDRIGGLRDRLAAEGADPDVELPADHWAAGLVAAEVAEHQRISEQQELARDRYRGVCAEHIDLRADDWLEQRIGRLAAAQTYWIAEPMATLVNAAYDSMPEHTLRPEDVPCPVGFMLVQGDALLSPRVYDGFDNPDDVPPGFTAVSWEPAVGQMVDSNADVEPGVRITWWYDVRSLPARYQELVLARGSRLIPHSIFWPYGRTEPPLAVDPDAAHGCRWLLAAWHMMTRPIAAVERPPVERAARKRAQRAGMAEPQISVVTLRHTSRPSGAPARKVDWKARWVVRGFWRQQWYPSLSEHRPVWIDEHVKGPEDRPLAIRPRVYAWRR